MVSDPSEVALCHVVPEIAAVRPLFPQMNGDDAVAAVEAQTWAREAMDACLSRVGNPNVEVYLESGVPETKVLERARALGVELLVIAAPHGSAHTSGTAYGLVRRAGLPVLVARASKTGPVLAATDLSDPSVRALQMASRQAQALGLELVALHVVDVERAAAWLRIVRRVAEDAYAHRIEALVGDATKELEALLSTIAPGARGEVRQGHASRVVSLRAQELGAALVVVSTHGRTGIDEVLVGSVAEAIVRDAPCSVLVVRHTT